MRYKIMKTSLKIYSCLFVFLFFSFSLLSENKKSMSMIGYWLTSQSIVQVKECDQSLCAIIEVIFVGDGTAQESILDNNNKDKSLRKRSLVGINLISDFAYKEGSIKLSGGKIYDPGRGRTFKGNIYLLQNGNLKVEGCLLRMCGHEEWKPVNVMFNDDGTRTATLKEII